MESTLILIGGLPASGKTTLAEALALKLGAAHLNTDKTRIALEFSGQYATAAKERIYEELLRQTKDELSDETEFIVVDATFIRESWREAFDSLARQYEAKVCWVFLSAEEKIIRQRMQSARKYSEADYSVYLSLKTAYEKMSRPCLFLRSDRLSLSEMIEQMVAYTSADEEERHKKERHE